MVSSEPTIKNLEAVKKQLLSSIQLLTGPDRDQQPAFIRELGGDTTADLLHTLENTRQEEGFSPEASRFRSEIMNRSEEGHKTVLLSEIDMLKKIKKSEEDQIHRSAFGLTEGAFPIRIRGHIVDCIWTGALRDKPFTKSEVDAIALLSEEEPATIFEEAQKVPILSPTQLGQVISLYKIIRDNLENALSQQIIAKEYSHQLLQSERTRSLGTLSSGVAHHFNSLLSVILGYSSLVLNTEKVSPESEEWLRQISDAAQRGRRLTEELLAFVGSDAEEEAVCTVHDTLNNAMSLLETQTTHHIQFVRELQAAEDQVLALPSSVHQIAFNLLTNVMDCMQEGGRIKVHTSNMDIDTGSDKQKYLRIELTDNVGALSELIEHETIEEALANLDEDMNHASLKLQSLYGMIGRLDGTFTSTYNEETGAAELEILLPVHVEKENETSDVEKKIRRRLAPSTIWIVDDDAMFREMCIQVLEEEGHGTLEIEGAIEFQDQWKSSETKPDLVVLDFSMPEYNGLEMREWLKLQNHRIPVILASGLSATQPDIRKALSYKKTFFLQKPFTYRELADTVSVAMGETLIGE